MKENSKMSKTKKWLIAIAVIIFFYLVANLGNSSSSDVKGTYTMGFYKCKLSDNGNCAVWQMKQQTMYCKTTGTYTVVSNGVITINGLYNNNCSWVSDQNGRYIIDGNRLVSR